MKPGSERRRANRLRFSYYMQVMNDDTQELVGHLSDISPAGFKVDSSLALPPGKDLPLRMEPTGEIGSRPFLVFIARSRWCAPDPIVPNMNNIGFQIVDMLPDDVAIYKRIVESYGG